MNNNKTVKTQVVVLGSGPAGYSAAFRCADLGLKTILIENYPVLGGVCLNVGCIPSKTLLHIAKVINDVKTLNKKRIFSNEIKIDINEIRKWKKEVINKLNTGLNKMAIERKLKIFNGFGKFKNANTIQVKNKNNETILIEFDNVIIATGSQPIKLPFFSYNDNRVWDSTEALELKFIPKKLLIVGGGVIGLEIATIYKALGSEIDILETSNQILSQIDEDVAKNYMQYISNYFSLILKTKITNVTNKKDGIYVEMKNIDNKLKIQNKYYDAVLIAVGRKPNSYLLDIIKIGVKIDSNGFIDVNKQMQTNIPHIYAIGDIAGQPMLAHKGIREGHLAAEVIAGKKHYFDSYVIPSIAYTDPEIAWVGLTEKEAIKKKIKYKKTIFPWNASGRAVSSCCSNGITKLIFNTETNKIIGGAVVGNNGGELLGEISLAIELGCDASDLALTIHAHPTLYETIGLASEIYEGTITDLLQ